VLALPIDSLLPEIVASLRRTPNLVIEAPPGAGKTTRVPEGVDEAKIRQSLMRNHGIEIAGGLGPLAGKVLRIGTMGYGSTAENVKLLLDTLEEALREQGHSV